jgi:hypothetical protein
VVFKYIKIRIEIKTSCVNLSGIITDVATMQIICGREEW